MFSPGRMPCRLICTGYTRCAYHARWVMSLYPVWCALEVEVMAPYRKRFRRRGSTAIIALVSLSVLLIAAGVELDYGRAVVSRQKDQVMADAAATAAMLFLPRYSEARVAGD